MAEAENSPVLFIQMIDKSTAEGVERTMCVKSEVSVKLQQDAVNERQETVKERQEIMKERQKTVKETQKEKPASKPDTGQYQEKRIRCPECKYYTTENEEKMTRHIRKMHRGENPFQCYMCDYSTYNKVCFEEHVRVHQGIKPYKCSFCPHRTVSKKNMKKHELVHRPDNPLKCQQCDYFGRHRRALDFHMRKCHYEYTESPGGDGSTLSCQRCGVKFENKDTLRAHNKSQRKCKDCDYIGCSRSLTTLHAIKKHGYVAPKKKPPTKKADSFKCSVCKWSSSHVARVLLHLIHHPNQKVDETLFDLSILRKHGIVR